MGKVFANDKESYKYLSESIKMHPSQDKLKSIMQKAGFQKIDYYNLTSGVVAVHKGYKF